MLLISGMLHTFNEQLVFRVPGRTFVTLQSMIHTRLS